MKHDFTHLSHPKVGTANTLHVYRDGAGVPVLVANRYERSEGGKFFLPFDTIRNEWKAPQIRPLYNLALIASDDMNEVVIVVEGEKCADALAELGYLVTTTFGGCKALAKSDLTPLAGRSVIIWPDHDDPGNSYAQELAERLNPLIPESLKIVPVSESLIREIAPSFSFPLPKGWDVADAIRDGWGKIEIDTLLASAIPALTRGSVKPETSQKGGQFPNRLLTGFEAGKSISPMIDRDAADATKFNLDLNETGAPMMMAEPPEKPTTDGEAEPTQPYAAPPKKPASDAPNMIDGMELWKTPQDETYATLRRGGHFEHWPTGSRTFRNFLSFAHYQAEGKAPSASVLEDRKRSIDGVALFEGETHPVFNRVAAIGRTIYLDLGDPDWQAVAITAEGWQVVAHPQARFRRSPSMAALPLPIRHDKKLEPLRSFLNVSNDDDFRMLVAWLIGCLHPKGPYPILILSGEQGSAKSTTAQTLRDLIDPANPSTRSTPNSEQDLVIAAKHNHILSFDNLSTVRPQMSDALCRIATGGGFGTRKLHTDTEEVLFNACRPCLLNGIPDLATRPDLADRSIGVTLPVIPPHQRKTLGSYNRDFAKAAPLILASLLDAASCALARIDSVRLSEAPRMADFAKWVAAAEPALGWSEGAFLDSYTANRDRSDQAAIEGNPVALAVLNLATSDGHWEGTATELKQALRSRYPDLTEDAHSFPRQENKLSNALRRVQPPLRRRGVTISFRRDGKQGARVIVISSA